MKYYLVFTILLLNSFSKTFACGYSPHGEDVRYCLFHPDYFDYKHYKAFYYNTNSFGFEYDSTYDNRKLFYEANEMDWYNYVDKKVALESISVFMNSMTFTDIHPNGSNEFLNYLYKNKKQSAIKYLMYAKKCEVITSLNFESDVWERNVRNNSFSQNNFLDKLSQVYRDEPSTYFKRKYAFLAIRLAYYSGNNKVIKDLFENQFKDSKKDYLYYWSAFFYAFVNENPDKMNDVAALLEHSPEKYYASFYYFNDRFNLQNALKFAETKNDIANLYAYASIQKVDKNLMYLKEIYKNNPHSKLLGFLLLREINKIEDWVYTPYYTNYLPSITQLNEFWEGSEENATTLTLRARSESDRLYAKQVLDFIQSIKISNVENQMLWRASEIQLLFITRRYDECLSKIKNFEKSYKEERVFEQIEKIRALCITSKQSFGKATIKPEVEPIIRKYYKDKRFLFALGRELEFRGNLPDAIALMSLTGEEQTYDANDVEWQDNRLKNSEYLAVFYGYFDYLDFVYSADELKKVVDAIHFKNTNDFEKFIYKNLNNDLYYLKDLLGTKYIREERLHLALKTFQSIGSQYFIDNYNFWERGKYDGYYAFNQNPFYKIKHTEDFIAPKETFIVTKLSVTEHLIKYINLANNPKTKDRDYYYFIVANCYYNMSRKGNSWMMRRYSYDYGFQDYKNESYIDDLEYRSNKKAKEYYQLAYKNAKTDKFKALCLRMIDFVADNYPNRFSLLKNEFPQYYSDLSGCENLENYFKARR